MWRAINRREGRLAILVLLLASAPVLAQKPPKFKTGFNLFSTQQDIQLGREAAAEVDKQTPLVTDPEVVNYVSNLGRRLAQAAPLNAGYPYQFKVVNSRELNAFALPGGFIYVNRGILESASNEAEVAGVIGHEIGHVALRHGTNQASKAMMAQMPLSVLGGMLGQSGSLAGQLAQLGIGFGLNSVLLKYSRSAESQSDEVGTYILYQTGYDPRAMAQFFQVIQQKYPQRTMQFFSSHPNPGNRQKAVNDFIPRLGPVKASKTDSPEFQSVKRKLLAMPEPPKAKAEAGPQPAGPPPAPSTRFVVYKGEGFTLNHPDNWEVHNSQNGVVIAPPGSLMSGAQGEVAQAYGLSIAQFQLQPGRGSADLREATRQFVESMRQANPNLRVTSQSEFKLRGRQAFSTMFQVDSPLAGQKENDQVVTVGLGNAVLAVIFIAPEKELSNYQRAFDAVLRSIDFR